MTVSVTPSAIAHKGQTSPKGNGLTPGLQLRSDQPLTRRTEPESPSGDER
jgi:hypothetical protein